MAAKRTEYTVELNGVETTMLLDSEDADRYRKAGAIVEKKTSTEPAKTSDEKVAPAVDNKAMKSPANK